MEIGEIWEMGEDDDKSLECFKFQTDIKLGKLSPKQNRSSLGIFCRQNCELVLFSLNCYCPFSNQVFCQLFTFPFPIQWLGQSKVLDPIF